MWFGIVGVYGFYTEIAEYNSSKPGVYEVSYSDNAVHSTVVTPGAPVDSTAV